MRFALVIAALLSLSAHAEERHSGTQDASAAVRAMQQDDAANPGMLWVLQGEQLWTENCQSCHGGLDRIAGVAARYPAWDASRARALRLSDRIDLCRTEQQHKPAFGGESEAMLALTAAIGLRSRGLPISVASTGPLARIGEAGRALFERRQGQIDLSCADCHIDLSGHHLGGATIPQGHPTGYPLYRLEWQQLGSLERRIRNCLNGMHAEPYADASTEMLALEVYLAQRANGLAIETPAVRP